MSKFAMRQHCIPSNGGRRRPRRALSFAAASVGLVLCAVPLGKSFSAALLSGTGSPRTGFGSSPGGARHTTPMQGGMDIVLLPTRPEPDLRDSAWIWEYVLRDLKLFPVREPSSAGDGSTTKPVLSEIEAVPDGTLAALATPRGLRLRKAALAVAGVAAVTMILRLVTLRLDVWAHGAAALLMATPSTLVAAAAGAAAGGLHTLSGPDHLAALAPLALKTRGGAGAAFRAGVIWGSGHVLGQVLLGLGLLVAGRCGLVAILGARFGWAAERFAAGAVGAVLVLIGGMGLKEAREWQPEDGPTDDSEAPANGCESLSWTTLGTGVLSGMHPDALLLCLPALTLPTRLGGLSYLLAFGVGTLAAMGGFTAALHCVSQRLGQRAVGRISTVAPGVSVAVGVAIFGTALGIPLLGGLM
mmetsp:Transcript_162833/g.517307  ORF Transcript_162833/g.517307 Transcript_162833/m.517307 type:complete len:414 (-) Transcript_162833:195-1436(-)